MSRLEDCVFYCYEQHKKAFETWEHGEPQKAFFDLEGLRIYYENGKWWHYKVNEDNSVEWW